MIRIYDFLLFKQPGIIKRIKDLFSIRKPRLIKAERIPVRLFISEGPFDFYRAVMQEKPRPGLAGLLAGEEAVNL